MATSDRPRAASRSATPQNSATMGVLLVVVALFVGLFLLVKGGSSTETATDDGKPGAGSGTDTEETTTTAPPTTTPVGELDVIVVNASGAGGRAGATGQVLSAVGYAKAGAKEAAKTATETTATTTIYFVDGFQTDAAGVAAAMGLGLDRRAPVPATITLKDGDVGAAKVIVMVGTDWDPANPPTTAPG